MNKVLTKVPEGWKELPNATTAPKGYKWYWNGISFWDNQCKIMLVKVESEEKQ